MRRDRGAALLLVLLLVALLAVVVLEFQRRARVDLRAAENLQDDAQAHALLRSGSGVAEQVLAIYSSNSIADMKSSAVQIAGGDLLWKFLFEGEPVAIPVPSESIQGSAGLRAALQDLYGRFPLGALVGDGAEPKRTVFKYYLGYVREYLLSRENKALDGVDTDALGQSIIDYLEQSDDPENPISDLAQLYQVEGVTAAQARAVSPFLDTRKTWKFNANARCIPLIMAMQAKTLDEATETRDVLRQDPIAEDSQIPNAAELGGVNPEFANSLTTKSSRVEVLLEAEVRGGVRRGKAVFEKGAQGQGGKEARFRLVKWAEGWVEDELGVLTATAPAPAPEGGTK